MFGTNPLTKKSEGSGHTLEVQSIFHTIQGEGPFSGRPAVFVRLAGCNLRCTFCDTDFESKRMTYHVHQLVQEISMAAMRNTDKKTTLVVITGGEPMLQNLLPLIDYLTLNPYNFDVQIETAGTVWVAGIEKFINSGMLTLVCSPKTGRVHEKIEEYCYDWKYLIKEGEVNSADGLPNMSTQIPNKSLMLYRPNLRSAKDNIWLQPCEAYKVDYKKVGWVNDGTESLDHLDHQPLADQQVTSAVRDEEQSRRNVILARDLAMKHNYRLSVQLHKILGLP